MIYALPIRVLLELYTLSAKIDVNVLRGAVQHILACEECALRMTTVRRLLFSLATLAELIFRTPSKTLPCEAF
jgi:hypothetical protein